MMFDKKRKENFSKPFIPSNYGEEEFEGNNENPNVQYRPVKFNQQGQRRPVPKPNFNPQVQQKYMQKQYANPDAIRNKKWNALLRIGALFVAILGMYISAQFSVDGFSFQVSERLWIGWGIAAILIVIESIWQKFGDNKTLFILAMVCYAYGIITNVVGILSNRGGYNGEPLSLAVPVIFGVLLEVFPEPVIAWAISGDTTSDPIGKMMEKASDVEFVGAVRNVPDNIRERIGR